MEHVDPAEAEGLNDDAPVAHGCQHLKNRRVQAGGQLQQKYIVADFRAQGRFPPGTRQHTGIHHQPPVADLSRVAGVDAFKGGKAGGPDLHRPAAQHDLSVKGQKHAGMARRRHGKGGAQIVRPIGEHIRQGQLGAGEYHGQVDIRQHERHGGSGVGHGIRAVGHHDAVIAATLFENPPGNELPFLRADVGGIQTHHVVHGNVVVGAQLV